MIISGACATGGSAHVLAIEINADRNKVDATFTVPSDYVTNQQVMVQLWSLTSFNNDTNTAACGSPIASAYVIITPALFLTKGKVDPRQMIDPFVPAKIDENVSVVGFGFTPHISVGDVNDFDDKNITLQFRDPDGTKDLNNLMDVNAIDLNILNALDVNITDDNVLTTVGVKIAKSAQSGGAKIWADLNGQFDVNIPVPYTTYMPFTPGVLPDTNITATDPIAGAVHAKIIVTPGISMGTDENVTVLICDGNRSCWSGEGDVNEFRYPIETAMKNNYIDNMNAVKGFMVEMCDGSCAAGNPVLVRIAFNTDMNMAMGPRRNYDNNMDASAPGKAKIDTDEMPEFNIDAVSYTHLTLPTN